VPEFANAPVESALGEASADNSGAWIEPVSTPGGDEAILTEEGWTEQLNEEERAFAELMGLTAEGDNILLPDPDDFPIPDFTEPAFPGKQVTRALPVPDQQGGQVFTMPYLLYLPEEYDPQSGKAYPMILFLQGSGLQGWNVNTVRTYGLPWLLDNEISIPFIVISPQIPVNTRWEMWLAQLEILTETVIEELPVDTNRVYVTGLSMGGYGTWAMAMYYPDTFAAAASVSGSAYFPPSFETNPHERLCDLGQVPLWAIHGAQDDISDPVLNKLAVENLRACEGGANVTWTLWEDTNHFTTVGRIYRDPEFYKWFLSYTLDQRIEG
jgi:predicted peptidase